MYYILYCRRSNNNPSCFGCGLLIPHTAPNPSVGKLQTTQINVDVFLYSATTIDYKTAEGVNMEVMQLHSSFMQTIDFVFPSSACAAADF